MSALTITKIIEAEESISKEEVMEKIEEALKREFDKVKIKDGKDGTPELSCRVKTKLMNPIVTVKGPIKIQIKENKAKIMIDADTKTNGWFWFTILISLFFWPLFILDYFMYSSQKKSSIQAFEKVFERMEFDLSGF